MSSHASRAHARLAPSAAHRWMNCAGSVRMCEALPDKGSVYADEGTAAHMLAEHCLQTGSHAWEFHGRYVSLVGERFVDEPGENCFLVDDEMVDGVQLYLDYVRKLFDRCDYYAIEERVALTHLHPEIFGTGDAAGYEEATEHLHVCDFKYGRGVAVEPEENEQELCYGSGLVRKFFKDGRPVRKVTLHIVQPRAMHPRGPARSWTTDLTGLRDFERRLKAAADATAKPDAPLKAGDHCKFCRASAICPERRRASLEAASIEFGGDGAMEAPDPARMSSAELGKLLSEIDQIESWCRRVREHAHAEAVHGRVPDGWKLVAKRATRKWKDDAAAAKALRMMFDLTDEEIYTRKLVTPAAADKLVGRADAPRLASFYIKQSSGTVLAPESDSREAVRADPSVEFGEQ